MSRVVRRVPLDFDWPQGEVWEGFLLPSSLRATTCPSCGGHGYSPRAKELQDLWYGDPPTFRPEDNGSKPFPIDHPVIQARAQRNVEASPSYYGTGDDAIRREARRLAQLWNTAWCHHLNADDVAALVHGGRLRDLTHTWDRENGWTPKDPPALPTPEEVNEWSLSGFGHDGINQWVVVQARCAREGVEEGCSTCAGHGSVEVYPGQRAEADAWTAQDPPAGAGWQLWESVSEGSPITPVFPTAGGLIEHLVTVGDRPGSDRDSRYSRPAAEALIASGWAPSGVAIGGKFFENAEALVALDGARTHNEHPGGAA